MDHPNVVKLFEVIDDPNTDKLYLVMEFVKKGAVLSKQYWKMEADQKNDESIDFSDSDDEIRDALKKKVLSEEKAKKYFRHLILGLEMKLSDFGISEIVEDGSDSLSNNAGTKFFMAPEAWGGKSYHGKQAVGGTLYYFIYKKPPFFGLNQEDLKKKIENDEVEFPPEPKVDNGIKALIKQCLEKVPEKRITIDEIMDNAWVTSNGTNPLENEFEKGDFALSDDDFAKAITKCRFRATVLLTAKMKKHLNHSRTILEKQKTKDANMLSVNSV
eukprot:CAMPEP_0114599644 /NCGR_PEP_ID=MMETSP0125-20121206/22172_1 /TAXON_ID=485358 ORGANISM="Aristerostoma sp., Strain ATCC 50986" /NCGR_SAMPLE_ID=MMETSP0125 /ASSEMBLY_ACC=CAM_ASM_000245 /LENGTH=271 /DNA_ID=CAMNT_0001806897 /DNA_START=324 /DNA_END=1140 /DNA_ORIENTATION=-